MVELENYFLKIFETWCTPVEIRNCPAHAGRKDEKVKQTGIFEGRTRVRYGYARYGWTRGGGKTWHGGIDLVGLDDATIRMPFYGGKRITGKVTRARRVTDKTNKTWEWGWYVCVRLDGGQTPDAVNFLYFALVLLGAMLLQHPVCQAISLIGAIACFCTLGGEKPGGFRLWYALALFAVLLVLLNVKRVKNLHPILFIAAGAVVGVLLRMH